MVSVRARSVACLEIELLPPKWLCSFETRFYHHSGFRLSLVFLPSVCVESCENSRRAFKSRKHWKWPFFYEITLEIGRINVRENWSKQIACPLWLITPRKPTRGAYTRMHTHIYTYMYICACECECVIPFCQLHSVHRETGICTHIDR